MFARGRVSPWFGALIVAGLVAPPVDAADARGAPLASIAGQITGLPTGQVVVVSLEAEGAKAVRAAPAAVAVIDQKRFQFAPAVLPVQRGTTVRFLNSDREPHNVFSPEGGYDLGTWGPGESREQRFDAPGVYVLRCNLHPEMKAKVVVLDTPFFGVTDDGGRFAIRDVPAGDYRFRVWIEPGPVERAVRLRAGRPLALSLDLGR